MSVPSRMSVHRFPKSLRPRVRIAQAAAWEALVDTHRSQLLLFVQEFAVRLPVLDALDLYFRVVAVPEPMHEAVRTRALLDLDLDALPLRVPFPKVRGWRVLRLDLVLENLRGRREYHETTIRLARMVGARAAEAVAATHVNNAIGFTQLLEGFLPLEKAVAYYVEEFRLPLTTAQVVMQRVQAALASRHLAAQYPGPRRLEPIAGAEAAPPPIVGTIRAAG